MISVNLWGTENDSTWREELIELCKISHDYDFTNLNSPEYHPCWWEYITRPDRINIFCLTPKEQDFWLRITQFYSLCLSLCDRAQRAIFIILKKDGDEIYKEKERREFMTATSKVKDDGHFLALSLKDAKRTLEAIALVDFDKRFCPDKGEFVHILRDKRDKERCLYCQRY
jgi:hypothetical protein